MTFPTRTALLAMTIALATPAMATINVSSNQEQGFTECTKSCTEFSQTQECYDFRQAKQICNHQKKTVPHQYSAAVLEELEEC